MAEKLEQIDYGGRPERMDPKLEKKLKDPEGLYSKNPAMKKGTKDVQRLVSSRFNKVAEKLRSVTGLDSLNANQVQRFYMQMMSNIPVIMNIESNNREALQNLAVKASLDETEVPENWVKIIPELGSPIDTSNFRYEPEDTEEEGDEEEKLPKMGFDSSFEIDDLTDEEQLELEKHKRNIINAIMQGAAKKGHYLFQKPSVKRELDRISPQLFPLYLAIMAVNDYMYFTAEDMIEMMSGSGQGVAGKVELDPEDGEEGEEDGGGEDENESNTVIKAQGLIFPILCHEIIKGIEESKARHGLPKDPSMREKVQKQVDLLSNEPMQLRIGPEIYEKIRLALPDEMYDDENRGLINWFQILLYQIPADDFLKIIGNAISEDDTIVKKATSKFDEIMREAKKMKQEFDDYREDNGSDDEDDDLDDFLSGLGISRPK